LTHHCESHAEHCAGAKICHVRAWVLRVPLKESVATSFGAMTSRPAVFLRIEAADGAWGWGEVFCNFPQVGAEYRGALVDSIFAPILIGMPSGCASCLRLELEALTRRLAIQCGEPGPFAQICGAIDQALWDIAGKRAGLPIWQLASAGRGSKRVRVYASGIGPRRVGEAAAATKGQGFRAFKFKVGFDPALDLRNFQEIRDAIGHESVVMVDANQAWTGESAADRIRELAPFQPLWVEEPIAADEPINVWRSLAVNCGVPLAAGENMRGIAKFRESIAGGVLRFIQPDVGKWGGVSESLKIGSMAAGHGVTYCPHWLGGGIGLAASLHARAALGPAGYAEVDVNPNPLRNEVFAISPTDGWIELDNRPGLGVEPDLARLARFVRAAG